MAIEKLFNCEGSAFEDLSVRKELVDLTETTTGDKDTHIKLVPGTVVIGAFLENTNGETIGVDGADKATGTVTFTGTASTAIPKGTKVKTSSGIVFETDSAVTIAADATTANADVTAVVAGASGNVDAAAINALVSPVTGVSAVTNANATSGGTETTFNIKVGSDSLFGSAVNVSAVSGTIVYTTLASPMAIATEKVVKLAVGSENTSEGSIAVGLVLLEL